MREPGDDGARPRPPAAARIGILYDVRAAAAAISGTQPDGRPGLAAADGFYQQQPSARVLPVSRQAVRVSGRPGRPDSSPSLVGRDAAGMAEVLRAGIARAGARLVFLDEMIPAFGIDEGATFDAALSILAREPSADGDASPARRVHVYLPPAAIADIGANPARWGPALSALTRSGGVWLEAYSGAAGSIARAPWSAEQWLAFTDTMALAFAAAGGEPARLHLLLTEGDQAAQWTFARTGQACGMLANGPGTYRIGASAADFVSQFRATFGTAPAPAGPSPVACIAARVLSTAAARALVDVLALDESGAILPAGSLSATRLPVGPAASVRLRLGPDPLGIAGRLGSDPTAFWAAARARVRVFGAGVAATIPVLPGGVATLPIAPTAAGPVRLRLLLSGAPIRAAIAPAPDLVASLAPFGERAAPGLARMLRAPAAWSLDIPLGTPTNPLAPAIVAGAPTAPRPARVIAALVGRRRVSALGLNPNRTRVVFGRVLTAAGRTVPRAPLVIRFPSGAGRRSAANADGAFRLVVPARAGRLVVAVAGRAGVRVVLTIPVPAPPLARGLMARRSRPMSGPEPFGRKSRRPRPL